MDKTLHLQPKVQVKDRSSVSVLWSVFIFGHFKCIANGCLWTTGFLSLPASRAWRNLNVFVFLNCQNDVPWCGCESCCFQLTNTSGSFVLKLCKTQYLISCFSVLCSWSGRIYCLRMGCATFTKKLEYNCIKNVGAVLSAFAAQLIFCVILIEELKFN